MLKRGNKIVTDPLEIERIRAMKRESNARCKDRIKRYADAYSKTEKAVANRRRNHAIAYSNPVKRLKRLAYNACKRHDEHDLSFMYELSETAPTVCKCCGVSMTYYALRGKNVIKTSPSFDRIDNSKGYVRGNVHIICTGCNVAKRDSTMEQLLNIINYIQVNSCPQAQPETTLHTSLNRYVNPQAPILLW